MWRATLVLIVLSIGCSFVLGNLGLNEKISAIISQEVVFGGVLVAGVFFTKKALEKRSLLSR